MTRTPDRKKKFRRRVVTFLVHERLLWWSLWESVWARGMAHRQVDGSDHLPVFLVPPCLLDVMGKLAVPRLYSHTAGRLPRTTPTPHPLNVGRSNCSAGRTPPGALAGPCRAARLRQVRALLAANRKGAINHFWRRNSQDIVQRWKAVTGSIEFKARGPSGLGNVRVPNTQTLLTKAHNVMAAVRALWQEMYGKLPLDLPSLRAVLSCHMPHV